MKIVSFRGGLGNQIFEYLFYLYLSEHFPCDNVYGYYGRAIDHNGLEIAKWFNVKLPNEVFFVKYIRKIAYCLKSMRLPWSVVDDMCFQKNGLVYEGWWQDKKYFGNYLKNLSFKNFKLSERNREILEMINKYNSVSIHVRRGDYLNPKFAPRYAGICTEDYYNRACKSIEYRVEDPIYFVFSDDIDWVKSNLHIDNAQYIDWNNGVNSFFDMYLMANCKHHIVANSTFSFWGAMLSVHKDCIKICPQKWFNTGYKEPDLFDDTWLRV